MECVTTKAGRLLQIESLFLSHPEGLTQSEIARRLKVNRSTVGRYIPDLPGHIYIDDLDGNRWKVDREAYLVNVRFSLHEALCMHMAARLLTSGSDKQNPHAAAALRKLAVALERLAPRFSQHIKLTADDMDTDKARYDPAYLGVLEKLTLAWAEERKAQVWHRHEPSGEVHRYLFCPYFIEPYPIGRTAHVIGLREPPGDICTFKIERVELLRERYAIPNDFNPGELLASAWGIWSIEVRGKGRGQHGRMVTLRFTSPALSAMKAYLEARGFRRSITSPKVTTLSFIRHLLALDAQSAMPRAPGE